MNNLPAAMKKAKRWLVYKEEANPDPTKKPRKIPYYPNGKRRNGALDTPRDVALLGTFEQAVAALATGKYTGLGFALGEDGTGNHWQGIDLDHLSEHPENHCLRDDLIGMTYCETSPNGDGIHAIGYGRHFDCMGSTADGLEAYSSGRFFTVTGNSLNALPPCELHGFVEKVLRPRRKQKSKPQADDSTIDFAREVVTPEQVTELRSALLSMRADDRELWVKIGHALKPLGEDGRGLFLEWSATSEKFDPADDARTWDSFKPTKTGYQAVFKIAQELGWVNPRSKGAGGDSSRSNGDGDSRSWPELADPFAEHVVPAFPLHVLPETMQVFCTEKSAQSGFDVGGYAFAGLIAAGNMVDHRVKMNVGVFSVPAFLWATLSGNSGAGKSPVLGEATKPAREIDDETVKQSQRTFAEWVSQCKSLPKGTEPPKPIWRQRNALDTTTEALALLLSDNPEGTNIHADELSEFIGRMDAYKGGSGTDRAVYLRAFDGGMITINRSSKNTLVVNNFSVGILAGIQPEKLAQMFKKSGGGSDGLFQRFLTYNLRPAERCDYSASLGAFTELNYGNVFRTLHGWTEAGTVTAATLCDEGRERMQSYHNDIRKLTSRTPSQRFAEHLDKYPGFLGRMAFALHCIECAAVGEYQPTVSADTLRRAIAIMQVMYRHSEATYAVLDSESGDVLRLVVSAAEAILTKGWHSFKRGDLTRNATYWQGADNGQTEGAIDFLIELGWLADVTPSAIPGKRGRRSDGVFQVNPLVHERFTDHATRVKQNRADRFSAIQQIAGNKLE